MVVCQYCGGFFATKTGDKIKRGKTHMHIVGDGWIIIKENKGENFVCIIMRNACKMFTVCMIRKSVGRTNG